MKLFTTRMRKWALVSIGAAAAAVAIGAGASKAAWEYFVQGQPATQVFILPGGNAKFDSDIARLDTRTGAVYRFRGNVDNSSVTNTWELRVPPVKEETSGLLEIQQVTLPRRELAELERSRLGFSTLTDEPQTTFLVDIANGKTWILRRRANTNESWDIVDIFKHNDWGLN